MIRFLARFVLVAAALLPACATPPPTTDADPDPSGAAEEAGSSSSLERVIAADNGLEMRRWVVANDPATLESALAAHADPYDEDETLAMALVRNGFELASIDVDDILLLRDGAGELMTDMTVWHGQAPQWRPTQRAAIGRSDLAVLLDGRVRIFRGGAFDLLLRSWTLPMEDGARLQLELVPQYEPPSAQGLRKLIGGDDMRGEAFRSLLVELQMTPGRAWVLTSLRGAPSPVAAEDGAGTVAETSAGSFGTGPTIGPDVEPPPTLGELLFVDRVNRLRTVLVFLAALPPGVVPDLPAPPEPEIDPVPSAEPVDLPAETWEPVQFEQEPR